MLEAVGLGWGKRGFWVGDGGERLGGEVVGRFGAGGACVCLAGGENKKAPCEIIKDFARSKGGGSVWGKGEGELRSLTLGA